MKRTTAVVVIGLAGAAAASVASYTLRPATALEGTGSASAAVPAANAQSRTQVFTVSNMTCATCPIAVKAAMERVAGVTSVHVDFDAKQASVVFDPAVTTADQIAAASTNVGFPASPKA